ncbi:hypothetical protein [Streptomyces sp. enrichment culture]|uniref:hypothetical protein n=1 Tax=Streptomyces sp. enrichment culture TaxID=1795815 RepID=UPI003F55CA1E
MDIPSWFVWIALGLAVLQAFGLVPVIRRLRESDSSARFEARLDLLDVVGSLLLFGGLMLSLAVAESWFWLVFAGSALMAAAYAVKGVHWLRARSAIPASDPNDRL